jgi:DNA-binding IclR family transcriptional regulator
MDRTLETTETSFDVIEVIQELEGATLSEIRDRMDVPKSTLYYHLNTLERRGYLIKERGEYNVGLKFLVHGQYARTRRPEFELARESTSRLANQLNENADFSVEEHGQLMVIHHVVGESAKHGFQLGQAENMPTTAAGKAILAEYPRSRVEEIVAEHGFEGTDRAPTSVEDLLDRLETVRERGFAVNDEEWVEGLCAMSGAVTHPDGSVLGALSVMLPSFRFDEETMESYALPLRESLDRLEGRLESQYQSK